MGTRNFSNVANSALDQTLSEVDDTNQEVDRAIPGNKETSYQQGDGVNIMVITDNTPKSRHKLIN